MQRTVDGHSAAETHTEREGKQDDTHSSDLELAAFSTSKLGVTSEREFGL